MSKWIRYTEHPLNPLLMDRQRWEAGPAFEKHRWCLVPENAGVPVPLFEYDSPEAGYPAYAISEAFFSDNSNGSLSADIRKRMDDHDFFNNSISFSSVFQAEGSDNTYASESSRELFESWTSAIEPYLAVACHPRIISNRQNQVFNQLKPLINPQLFAYRSDQLYIQQFRSEDLKELVPIFFDAECLPNFYFFPSNEILHISVVLPFTQVLGKLVGLSSYTDFDVFRNLVGDLGWMITTHSNVKTARPICVYARPAALLFSSLKPGSRLNIEWLESTNLFETAATYQTLFPPARARTSLLSANLLSQPQPSSKLLLVNTPVAHLDELTGFPAIVNLEIDHNYIWNLANTLTRLTHLESLSFSNMTIASFEFLSQLSKLVMLKLVNIQHSEVLNLPGMPELKTLHIQQGGIHAVNFLETPDKLELLDLTGSNIRDLQFLKNCRALSKVKLDGSKVNDLGPLHQLPELVTLSANVLAEQDWQSVSKLGHLKSLLVSSNEIDRLSYFSGLSLLKRLDVSNNLIRDLKELSFFPHLTHLNLGNNRIENLEGIAQVVNLVELNLAENNIGDYALLCEVSPSQLKKLGLGYSGFNNLQYITHFNQLTELNISGTLVKEISLLNKFRSLEELHVGCCVFDFGLMESIHLPTLVSMHLNGNTLDNLRFLKNFEQLKELSLADCTIKEIDGIRHLSDLEELDLRGTKLQDFSFLLKLEKLRRIAVNPSMLSREILHELKEARKVAITEVA